MDGINGSPLGSAVAVPKQTGLDTVTQIVQAPKTGSSLVQKKTESLEELTFVLSQKKDLNKERARESRKDFKRINIRGLATSFFSVQQVESVQNTANNFFNKHLSQEDLIKNLKQFRREFSQDNAHQYLGLLSLKQKIKDSGIESDNVDLTLKEIDTLLEPANHSLEFQALVQSYSLMNENLPKDDEDRKNVQKTLQPVEQISFDSLEKATQELRKQFGDNNIQQGTDQLFRQQSNRYHAAGRNIDKHELFELMKNMSQLKTMLGIFDECRVLAQLIKPHDPTRISGHGFAAQLLHEVTTIQNKLWLEQADLSTTLQHLKVSDIGQKNVIGVQLKRILGLIPEHFFREHGQKQRALEVVSKFMDLMARREAGYA